MPDPEHVLKELEKRWVYGNKKSISYFKRLILLMYENFPNFRVAEKAVKEIIIMGEDRKFLCKHGFFIEEKTNEGHNYGLGPNALSLVSAWKTEELNKRIFILTLILVGISLLQISLIIW